MKYLVLPVLILMFACDEQRVFEENRELDNAFWLADSAKDFTFTINDTTSRYNIYYSLRNTASYPFRNIYIDYVLEDTTGRQLEGSLVNQQLFHPKTGEPYGSGLGDVFDHQFLLLENYPFPAAGNYIMSLRQYMRRDTLKDVVAVGIRVEKASKED
jgi:gliding motility-associated lipoprotein GldH